MPRLDGMRARRQRANHRRERTKAGRKAKARYLRTLNPGKVRFYTKEKR